MKIKNISHQVIRLKDGRFLASGKDAIIQDGSADFTLTTQYKDKLLIVEEPSTTVVEEIEEPTPSPNTCEYCGKVITARNMRFHGSQCKRKPQ